MPALETKPMTIEEFSRMTDPQGFQSELVRGEIVLMPLPKARHGICCAQISCLLGNFVDDSKIGWLACNNAGVILERDPDTVRGPDVAYWSITRQPKMPEDYFEIPPDLAVEVLSPGDRRKNVREKIKDYVKSGVKLIWLVDPDTRTVTVYQGSLRGMELDEADTLTGGDVLTGFSCNVADLFA